jgi:hypothetical protein
VEALKAPLIALGSVAAIACQAGGYGFSEWFAGPGLRARCHADQDGPDRDVWRGGEIMWPAQPMLSKKVGVMGAMTDKLVTSGIDLRDARGVMAPRQPRQVSTLAASASTRSCRLLWRRDGRSKAPLVDFARSCNRGWQPIGSPPPHGV